MQHLIPDEFAVSFIDPHAGKLVCKRSASPVNAIWEIGRTLDAFWLERSIAALNDLLDAARSEKDAEDRRIQEHAAKMVAELTAA